MDFLIRAYKKQRRRLRTENLLLLLLRCLIPVLLALAIARPYFSDIPALLAKQGQVHHIFVLDHSFSMEFEPSGAQSPRARAISIASQKLEQLEDQSNHKVSLILGGVRPISALNDESDIQKARTRLAEITQGEDSSETILPALAQVADWLEERQLNPEGNLDAKTLVYLFTDLHKGSFGIKEANPSKVSEAQLTESMLQENAKDLLQRIGKLATVQVMDVGTAAGESLDNMQITDLRLEQNVALVRVPNTVVAKVRNRGLTTKNIEVALTVDESQQNRKLVRVEAGAETEVSFQTIFRSTGFKRLQISIEGDGLRVDNQCFHVVQVRERIQVLMVEGSNEKEEDDRLRDSGLLRQLLDPTRGTGPASVTEFQPTVIDLVTFLTGQHKASDYDMVVLANAERLNATAAQDLRMAIKTGTGLLVMLGSRCEPENYNLHLHDSGIGPMPMRILSPDGYQVGGKEHFKTNILKHDHPVFAEFSEAHQSLVEVLPVHRYWSSDLSGMQKQASVLWQVRNTELSPLLVANNFGEGRCLFLTSAISEEPKRWNHLDVPPGIFALTFFQNTARYLSQPISDPFNVWVGSPLTAKVETRPNDLAIVLPERAGGEKKLVSQSSRHLAGGQHALPPFHGTTIAGLYQFEMNLDSSTEDQQLSLPFAVNINPAEGKLAYHSHQEAAELLGVERILQAITQEDQSAKHAGYSEWGPTFLWLVLFFILGEASFARLISRRRI